MGEIIEITSDGIVELKTVTTARRVPLKNFTEALLQASGVRTPILPQGVVFYSSRDHQKVYLIEREPMRVKILYDNDRAHAKEFTLFFPWHYFLISLTNYAFERCYFYFRNKRIMSVEDKFCLPPLPNLHSPDCNVCLGDFRYKVTAETPEKMVGLVEYFFASTFNNDLNQFFTGKIPKQISALKQNQNEHCFDAWQRLKSEDACLVDWVTYQSLDKCLDNIWEKE